MAIAAATLGADLELGGLRKWTITASVMVVTVMQVLDVTVTNVALPHIQGSLSAGVDEVSWVLTSYLAANAVILPATGWLAGVLGRKKFFLICTVMFTGSSVLCGLAMSFWGMGIMMAPIFGPTIGGWISDNWSWRWIFYINVPIGVVGFLVSSAVLFD